MADDDRDLFRRHVEALEQRLHARVALELHAHMGMSVAREKLAELERSGAGARTDERHPDVPGGDERHAAQDERAHHDFRELGVGPHQLAQPLGVNSEHRAAFTRPDTREARDAA